MFTYLYPASRRPVLTMASAVERISPSSMLQPKRFQLFQPMGGAEIGPGAGVAAASAIVGATVSVAAMAAAVVRAAASLRMLNSLLERIDLGRYATGPVTIWYRERMRDLVVTENITVDGVIAPMD